MPERYVEKSFLALLVLSLLLHIAAGVALYKLPAVKPPPPKEPVFIDLQAMPEVKSPTQEPPVEPRRQSERRTRVEREQAPRGTETVTSSPSRRPVPETARTPAQMQTRPRETAQPGREAPVVPGSSASALLKPRAPVAQSSAQPQLFPSASKMARLEENYRKKFERDIAEGDTLFLNSDDMLFGSFLRRFENSVYGVWRYPQEAAMKGIEGITPVKITFNRRGEIIATQLLESSGAKVLDDEVFRTLRMIGPVGGFPKGYDKDEFHLIAFFQYGVARRSLR